MVPIDMLGMVSFISVLVALSIRRTVFEIGLLYFKYTVT